MPDFRPLLSQRLLRPRIAVLLTALALFAAGCGETRAESEAKANEQTTTVDAQAAYLAKHGITITPGQRDEPREIRYFVAKIDLKHPGTRLACFTAPDPDGDGPAETQLATPLAMAREHNTLLAFNANAFAMINGSRDYIANGPADIHGIAIDQGKVYSTTRRTNAAFWIDKDGQPHITARLEETPTDARFGVAGFQALVIDGEILPKPKDDAPLAPRTVLGIDKDGRFAYLLTVDGRQPGYSMGMNYHELASMMVELGCHNALNLDGGGSTALIAQHPEGGQHLINKPSTNVLGISIIRPVAVTVGVVKASDAE